MMISASIIYVEALRDFSTRQDDTIGTFLILPRAQVNKHVFVGCGFTCPPIV